MPDHNELPTRESISDCVVIIAEGWMYQARARVAFEVAGDVDLEKHAWLRSTCGNRCINPAHLVAHQPVRIAYPAGVCVYCGFPSGTKDHLVPRAWTGEVRRHKVATVPACADCNSRIGDFGSSNIDERRERAKSSIRRRYRNILGAPVRTAAEMAEFGPTLRRHIESRAQQREGIESRLAWPEDPFYDMRAWQQSGVEDPVALGVINSPFSTTHLPTPASERPANDTNREDIDHA